MTWEVYSPKLTRPVARGEASLSAKGTLTVLDVELEAAGITGKNVVVEINRPNRQVLLREPVRADEPHLSFCAGGRKGGRSSKMSLTRVLDVMGIKHEAAARCPVFVRPEGGLIVTIPGSIPKVTQRATPIRKEAGHG
jgi:hypothetical protein